MTEVVRDSGANRTSAGPETRNPGWDAEANRGDNAFYPTHLSADIEGFTPPASGAGAEGFFPRAIRGRSGESPLFKEARDLLTLPIFHAAVQHPVRPRSQGGVT
jgi:hypothetical protein